MLKLKTNKAHSLLEVIIAVSIFTTLTFCGFSVYGSVLKQRNYYNKLRSYLDCMEIVAGNLQGNYSYNELIAMFGVGKKYINYEAIDAQYLFSTNISSILNSIPSDINNNISIEISGSDVLKLTLQGKFSVNGRVENIKSEVYKGSYN